MQQILQEMDRSKKIFIMLTKFNEEIEKYRRFLLIAKSPDQVEFLNQEIQKRNFAIAKLQAEYDALAQSARNRAASRTASSAASSAATSSARLPGRKNANRNNGATKRWSCEGGICGWIFGSKTRKLTAETAQNAAAQAAANAAVQAAQAARAARLAQAAAAQAAEQAEINAEVNALAATLPRGPPLEGADAELAAQVAQLEAEVAAGQHGPLGSLEPEHQAIQEDINRGAQQIQGLTNTLIGLRKRGGKRKTSKLRKTRKQKKNRVLK